MFDLDGVRKLLDSEVKKRDSKDELSLQRADPLLVAYKYKDEYISLICAMYAYGNANLIVKFLSSLDFSLLDTSRQEIVKNLNDKYYRFQSRKDTQELFITLNKIKKTTSLQKVFLEGYQKNYDVMEGIYKLIEMIYDANPYRSRGYEFLIGKIPKKNPTSPYKRWHMYLRWMVRDDNLDMGLWSGIKIEDLLIPLDTHTFKIGQKLGLVKRKTYDFKAVVELTNSLKKLDKKDPIKYDFALYRIGQEKIIR
ncbi:MAG: TIGR02757 family protein [Campylobacteraceae bacterium]|nr:TIGR02757 family protein [Campylobacteraceae bacterium]